MIKFTFIPCTLFVSGSLPDLLPEEALSSMNPPKSETGNFQQSTHSVPSTFVGNNPLSKKKGIMLNEGSTADTILPGTVVEEKQEKIEKQEKVEKQESASETSLKSSVYSPSRNALMKAGWFGVFDPTVTAINDVNPTDTGDRGESVTDGNSVEKMRKSVGMAMLTLPNSPSNQLLSGIPSQPVSPLESPLRLTHHAQPTWNIDSSTQTGSSLKLNGKNPSARIVSSTCKSCSVM